MNQEMASVIHFVNEAAAKARPLGFWPYYHEMPQDFELPCVYFPAMEVSTRAASLNSFELEYLWKIEFFDARAQDAFSLALTVLNSLQQRRNYVELINKDGLKSGETLRLNDSSIKRLKTGAAQLVLSWKSYKGYGEEDYERSLEYFVDFNYD